MTVSVWQRRIAEQVILRTKFGLDSRNDWNRPSAIFVSDVEVPGARLVRKVRAEEERRGTITITVASGVERDTALAIAREAGDRFVGVGGPDGCKGLHVRSGRARVIDASFDPFRITKYAGGLIRGANGEAGNVRLIDVDAPGDRDPLGNIREHLTDTSIQRLPTSIVSDDAGRLRCHRFAYAWSERQWGSFAFVAGIGSFGVDIPSAGIRVAMSRPGIAASFIADESQWRIAEIAQALGDPAPWIARGPYLDFLDSKSASIKRTESFSAVRVHDLVDQSMRRLNVERWAYRVWPRSWMAGMALQAQGMYRPFEWEAGAEAAFGGRNSR